MSRRERLLETDWDDLRYFLAVAREGSLSAAANALGVTHTTVSRRIGAFETRLGVRLFERLPTGFATTTAGDDMRVSAERIEDELARLDRSVIGRDERLRGTIRVALTDLAAANYMPHFEAFGRAYPCITLELVTGLAMSNLTQREADVALRVTDKPEDHLVGRRLVELPTALYAARAYLEARPHVEKLDEHRFIGWDDGLPAVAPLRWVRENVPADRITLRVNSPLVMLHAVRGGLGVGQLLCHTGDADPDLVRLTEPDPKAAVPVWLLTHRDLRNVARIRRFLDFIGERVRNQAAPATKVEAKAVPA